MRRVQCWQTILSTVSLSVFDIALSCCSTLTASLHVSSLSLSGLP
jgi:hypothetical protein